MCSNCAPYNTVTKTMTSQRTMTCLGDIGSALGKPVRVMTRTRLDRYMQYGNELAETDICRTNMADMIQDKLPVEVQTIIFGFVAVAVLPDSMHFHEDRGPISPGVINAIRAHCPDTSTLEAASHLVLSGLCKMRVTQCSLPSLRASMSPQRDIFSNTDELSKIFGQQVKEAILENITIFHDATFPTKGKPNLLPYPAQFQPYVQHITRLHLIINLCRKIGSGTFYPTMLYSAQDGIPTLKSICPMLYHLLLHVIENDKPGRNYLASSEVVYLARFGRGGERTTTFVDEVSRIVTAMRELQMVGKKVIRYSIESEMANPAPWELQETNELEAGEIVERVMAFKKAQFYV